MSGRLTAGLGDIRLFVAVYEERSFTHAAERENATQSGVSQHIRKIEDRSGIKLFSRAENVITPTPAADAFYRRCLEVLRAVERADRELREFEGGFDEEITVGLIPTVARCVLGPALARFVEAQPNVAIRIEEGFSNELARRVLDGEVDFGVVPAQASMAGLITHHFVSTPEILVSSANCGLVHMAPVRLAELSEVKMVVPGPKNIRRQVLDNYCASNGLKVARRLELHTIVGTLDFIAQTDWKSIFPGIMMIPEIADPRLTLNPLVAPALNTDLIVLEPARRTLSGAARAFLQELQTEVTRLNSCWQRAKFTP